MEEFEFAGSKKTSKLEGLSKADLIERCMLIEDELARVVKENYELRNQKVDHIQLKFILQEQLNELKRTIYGSSSERHEKPGKKKPEVRLPAQPRIKKPSERYPHIPVREVVVKAESPPSCESCGKEMRDTGMTEDSEQLTVIPKKYEIILQKRVKYGCSCQGCIITARAPLRIIPGSTYSDEMILDVVLSKYCDLIPMERYVAMAGRNGLLDLPAHSLIELSHGYADFVKPVYELLKNRVMESRVLCADETPHRMLEGSSKKKWYLWGFSTVRDCFLDCRDTRSGDVASDILVNSRCEILMSDVYGGYGKAVRVSNLKRKEAQNPLMIQSAHCNAHARRYFFKAHENGSYPESEFYLDHYQEIYELEGEAKGKPPPEILKIRSQMKGRFEAMKSKAEMELLMYPKDNQYAKGLSYFLDNYRGLTMFMMDAEIPIDNNSQERLLRNPVIGRKTWYGTHSKLGAKTASILFSLVESCKLNHVNPREYFGRITQDLLVGEKPYTPNQFKVQEEERARSETASSATLPQ